MSYRMFLLIALLAPSMGRADTWVPLKVFNNSGYEIDPATVQSGTKTDASKTPVIGLWVRVPVPGLDRLQCPHVANVWLSLPWSLERLDTDSA
jgi:hypothetical protein